MRVFVEHAAVVGQPLENNYVSDCNFSKCGKYLAVGTSYGSFSVYGYGGGELFEHQDMEQFRSNDYIQTSLHPDTYAIIDVDTGLDAEVSDAAAFDCNLNMTPH